MDASLKPAAGNLVYRDVRPAAGSLAELTSGEQATVARVTAPDESVERLMEMGMVPGTPIDVVRAGSRHMLVRLRGFTLGLGRHEAAKIEVVGPPRRA